MQDLKNIDFKSQGNTSFFGVNRKKISSTQSETLIVTPINTTVIMNYFKNRVESG